MLLGTQYLPDLEGKILFIEEAEDVKPAMVHRFFTHLSQCTDLRKLKGVCVGRFSSLLGFTLETEVAIYDDIFGGIDIPVLYNLDFGHTDPLFTIPIRGTVSIDTSRNILRFN